MRELTLDPPTLDMALAVAPLDPPGSDGTQVMWALHEERPVVVKSASGRARAALRREAEALERIDVPGLVEVQSFIDDETTTALVLLDAGRRTLDNPGTTSAAELLRALLHASQVVADLHERGWTHGNLRAEHVIVGPRGRVRLCSLGSARPVVGGTEGERADSEALLDLVEEVVSARAANGGAGDPRQTRQLEQLVRDLRSLGHPVDAAGIASRLRAVNRGEPGGPGSVVARLRERSPDLGVTRAIRWVGAVVAVALLVVSAALLSPPGPAAVGADGARGSADPRPITTTLGSSEATARRPGHQISERPTVHLDGSTYRVGLPGDLTAVGDWDCDGHRTVRVLRPATGELFEFDDRPVIGQHTEARLLEVTSDAVAIRSEPTDVPRAGARCDHMVIRHDDGTESGP